MKKLAELTTTEFVDLLASDAPAPGGGSAAALEGALGAALSAMVCGLTTVGKSKEKYADYQEFVIESQKKLTELKVAFVDVMDRDTEAFNVVSAAFGMPKATDEEKAARSAAIQKGLEGCTATPFEMMELCCKALEMTHELLGKTNDSAGAWLNVLINIGSLKNKDLAADYKKKGEEMLAKALPLADKIYENVLAQM